MMTRTRYDLKALSLLALLSTATAAEAQVRPELAQRYFDEAKTLCERDAGRLWGVSLCGPIVIVDQATGTRATSQPEPAGQPPRFPGLADAILTWGGVRWLSVPLQMLPENGGQQMLLHGLFHRIQGELGLNTNNGFNDHLDSLEGRVWLQLEWRALRRALESSGTDRTEAIADALAFRRERRLTFLDAADNERREEIREGLAAYTGVAASADTPEDARRLAGSALARGPSQQSFIGGFGYTSGPAYGVLLDDLVPGWRRQVRGTSDLGDLLASGAKLQPSTDVTVAAGRYDAATLRTAEEARDRAQQARVADLRRRFVEGPVLIMPAGGSGTSDSRGSVAIPAAGTVFFSNYTLSAQWGRLNANSGVLRSADGATLSVPVTGPLEGTPLQGDGWSATLNSGWVVRPAVRRGSFTIVREN
jgi:hypothetical protein